MKSELIFEETAIGYLDQVAEMIGEDGVFHYMPYRNIQHLHFIEKINNNIEVGLVLKKNNELLTAQASRVEQQSFIMLKFTK